MKKLAAALAAAVLPVVGSAQPAPEPTPAAPPPPAPPPAAAPKPPAAPAPLAQIYGTLNANIQNDYANAGPNKSASVVRPRQAISLDSTNIGLKGTFNTKKWDISVVYQCETSAKLDGITASVGGGGTTNINDTGRASVLSFLCDRNSRLGLSHPIFGTLFFGNWDTPFKAAYYGTKADDPFGNTDVFGANNIMGSPGFARTSGGNYNQTGQLAGVASFDIRANNSIAYHSPKIMGLSFKLHHVVNEFADTKRTVSPYLWAVGVNYDMGPLSVLAAWERHDDWQGLALLSASTGGGSTTNAVGSTQDQAWRVGAGYELKHPFGATTVSFVLEQLIFHQSNLTVATNVRRLDRMAYQASLKHRWGDHEFRFRWNRADGWDARLGDNTRVNGVGTGAYEYTVGYAYYLASSTQLYAFWTRIENERNARYIPGAGGSTSASPALISAATGADPEAFGAGIRYAF